MGTEGSNPSPTAKVSIYFFLFGSAFLTGVFFSLKHYFPALVFLILIFKLWQIKKFKHWFLIFLIIFFILGYLRVEKENNQIIFPLKATIVSSGFYFGNLKYYYTNKKTIVFLPSTVELQIGDKIIIDSASLIKNEFFNKKGFSYQAILSEDVAFQENKILKPILVLKSKLESLIEKNLSFVSSQIVKGILLGQNPDQEIKNKFKQTGLLHLLVVSGQNLTLMAGILLKNFSSFFNRRLVLIISIILGIIFSFLVFELATFRAVLMTTLLLIFLFLGRPVLWRNIILFTLIIFSLISPHFFFNDLSFQLSILAIIGLFYFVPVFKNIFHLPSIISEILAVQTFLAPFLLYNFGSFSFNSFLNNLIILPLFPFIFGLLLVSLPFLWFWPVKLSIDFIFLLFDKLISFLSVVSYSFNFYLPTILVYLIYGLSLIHI